MLHFSKKHKTPISTYTDSYRPPCSVKKIFRDQTPQLWKENKFVTQGLRMPPVQNPASQGQPEVLIKAAMQERYRNTNTAAYWPEKHRLAGSKEKYKPYFVNEDKHITWRAGPYNSAAWKGPRPKETRMETFPHSAAMLCPLKPPCLYQCEGEVATDTLHRLPMYTAARRGPFQGYYSPCSGRHYCLREMDYSADEGPAISRHLCASGERDEYTMQHVQPHSNIVYVYTSPPAHLLIQEP
ncbi:PREDICTED: spermatid-specific manchette-related protein 1 [Eurypyga helias]|uniref:Spermatid-specific manchette-related protein 1 n=1 Tax=Eurypyga helias TaxID=54383 RepID=A0A093IL61_EURHL|nr:PREDICTED: spermatid-specific manchette-related protein 1 [Eurypyga helias]KFW00347.1 Spermatid-specific manchette-related protein 1 [Eurypyga helias]